MSLRADTGIAAPKEQPRPPCCFAHPQYAGTCVVYPAKGETCASILTYLNKPRSTGKTYCENTTVRGGVDPRRLQGGRGRRAVAAHAAEARHLEESAQRVRKATIGSGLGGGKPVMPKKHLRSDERRDAAREAGLKVATGVVDDPEELWPRARFDLYGMAPNRPGILLEGIREDG